MKDSFSHDCSRNGNASEILGFTGMIPVTHVAAADVIVKVLTDITHRSRLGLVQSRRRHILYVVHTLMRNFDLIDKVRILLCDGTTFIAHKLPGITQCSSTSPAIDGICLASETTSARQSTWSFSLHCPRHVTQDVD